MRQARSILYTFLCSNTSGKDGDTFKFIICFKLLKTVRYQEFDFVGVTWVLAMASFGPSSRGLLISLCRSASGSLSMTSENFLFLGEDWNDRPPLNITDILNRGKCKKE